MKLKEMFHRAPSEPGTPEYDPRAQRAEISETIAGCLQMQHPELQIGRVAHGVTGPLGGESSKFFIIAVVDGLPRKFIINIYAYGVFAPD